MPCFGDFNTLKQLVVGLFLPIYFTCVMIQQIFSSGYGTWFFMHLESEEATQKDALFVEMDSDCLDLVKFFFLNECIVGFLTAFQCFVIMCCGFMKSRHLREIEGEVYDNNKRTSYYKNEINQSRLKSIQSGTPKRTLKKKERNTAEVTFAEHHSDARIVKRK